MRIIDSYPDEKMVVGAIQAGESPRVGDFFRSPETGMVFVVTKRNSWIVEMHYDHEDDA